MTRRTKRRHTVSNDRKTMQLCRQVGQTLAMVLSGECGDDLLRDLEVISVEPAPNVSQLLVVVRTDMPAGSWDPTMILDALNAGQGFLRSEVAAAIHRRRVPKLLFQVATFSRPNAIEDV